MTNTQASDDELDKKLIDILEPHYWNMGFEARESAKGAVEKSVTFKVLKDLIHQHTATVVEEALDNRDKTVRLTVGVVLTPYIGKDFIEYYDEYKKYDQELNRTSKETVDE